MYLSLYIVGFLAFIVGATLMYFKREWDWKKKIKNRLNSKVKRKGLFKASTRVGDDGGVVNYEVEFYEIERTAKMTKIEPIEVFVKEQDYNSEFYIKQMKSVVRGWKDINDTRIHWFQRSAESVRDDKLSKLLDK